MATYKKDLLIELLMLCLVAMNLPSRTMAHRRDLLVAQLKLPGQSCLRNSECVKGYKCVSTGYNMKSVCMKQTGPCIHCTPFGERCTPADTSECFPPYKCVDLDDGNGFICQEDPQEGCIHCKNQGQSCSKQVVSECKESPVKLVCRKGICTL